MSIILCGLPCSGKTTMGKALAVQLGWAFIDTDQLIERALPGLSCREIYQQRGKAFFRKMEKEQIFALKGVQKHVIALGGGSFDDPENVNVLQSLGCIVYLKLSPEVIWKRMQKRGLTAHLKGREDFDRMVKRRIPQYEKLANYVKVVDGE